MPVSTLALDCFWYFIDRIWKNCPYLDFDEKSCPLPLNSRELAPLYLSLTDKMLYKTFWIITGFISSTLILIQHNYAIFSPLDLDRFKSISLFSIAVEMSSVME